MAEQKHILAVSSEPKNKIKMLIVGENGLEVLLAVVRNSWAEGKSLILERIEFRPK